MDATNEWMDETEKLLRSFSVGMEPEEATKLRDEQLILLNWLSSKEKTLKDMGRTDLTDEDEVKKHLEKLKVRLTCPLCTTLCVVIV